MVLHFDGRDWPSKSENAKKRHKRVQIGRIACDSRPENYLIMGPYNLAKFQIDTTPLTPSKML
jgi:hypothetical protein